MGEETPTVAPRPPNLVDRYLALADDMSAAARDLAAEATAVLSTTPDFPTTYADRVLVALALKVDSAFDALIADALVYRSEAMHHLKTMVEASFYYYEIARDRATRPDVSTRTAEMIVAEAYALQAEMLRERNADPAEIAEAERQRDALLRGDRLVRRQIKAVATSVGMSDWYWGAYKLACQPAHLGDLADFMPADPPRKIVVGSPAGSARFVIAALHYGINVMLGMMAAVNMNALDVRAPVETFQRRFDEITGRRPGDAMSPGGS